MEKPPLDLNKPLMYSTGEPCRFLGLLDNSPHPVVVAVTTTYGDACYEFYGETQQANQTFECVACWPLDGVNPYSFDGIQLINAPKKE